MQPAELPCPPRGSHEKVQVDTPGSGQNPFWPSVQTPEREGGVRSMGAGGMCRGHWPTGVGRPPTWGLFPQGSKALPPRSAPGPPVRAALACHEPLGRTGSLLRPSSICVTFESLSSLAIFLFHFKTFPTFQAFMRFAFSCISSRLVFTSK